MTPGIDDFVHDNTFAGQDRPITVYLNGAADKSPAAMSPRPSTANTSLVRSPSMAPAAMTRSSAAAATMRSRAVRAMTRSTASRHGHGSGRRHGNDHADRWWLDRGLCRWHRYLDQRRDCRRCGGRAHPAGRGGGLATIRPPSTWPRTATRSWWPPASYDEILNINKAMILAPMPGMRSLA